MTCWERDTPSLPLLTQKFNTDTGSKGKWPSVLEGGLEVIQPHLLITQMHKLMPSEAKAPTQGHAGGSWCLESDRVQILTAPAIGVSLEELFMLLNLFYHL